MMPKKNCDLWPANRQTEVLITEYPVRAKPFKLLPMLWAVQYYRGWTICKGGISWSQECAIYPSPIYILALFHYPPCNLPLHNFSWYVDAPKEGVRRGRFINCQNRCNNAFEWHFLLYLDILKCEVRRGVCYGQRGWIWGCNILASE